MPPHSSSAFAVSASFRLRLVSASRLQRNSQRLANLRRERSLAAPSSMPSNKTRDEKPRLWENLYDRLWPLGRSSSSSFFFYGHHRLAQENRRPGSAAG